MFYTGFELIEIRCLEIELCWLAASIFFDLVKLCRWIEFSFFFGFSTSIYDVELICGSFVLVSMFSSKLLRLLLLLCQPGLENAVNVSRLFRRAKLPCRFYFNFRGLAAALNSELTRYCHKRWLHRSLIFIINELRKRHNKEDFPGWASALSSCLVVQQTQPRGSASCRQKRKWIPQSQHL